MQYRTEQDALGKLDVPEFAYWGIHTQRATANFQLSQSRLNPSLIRALAMVKKACAEANRELGYLDELKAGAIAQACNELIDGKLAAQFPVDALQGGAGTSANMNANEVIANRAIELLDGTKGDYRMVDPLAHVNLHQSTNDVFPTAVKVACVGRVRALSDSCAKLQGAFQEKERDFAHILKIGRTEMQEAVPMTLGAEFSAFAEAVSRDRWRTFKCEERLRTVNLGGTAIGTGLGAPRNYIFLVIEKLRQITGLGLNRAENLVGETANADVFVEVSGILKAHAATLSKISTDLRLLNLLGEINLPPVQAGSSIMPGKVNPVVCEAVAQASVKVCANDFIVTECAARGTFQINEFMPLLAYSLLESADLLINADTMLSAHVRAVSCDEDACRRRTDAGTALITPFVPHIGYAAAEALALEYAAEPRGSLRDFLIAKLGAELVNRVLDPFSIVALGYKDEKNS